MPSIGPADGKRQASWISGGWLGLEGFAKLMIENRGRAQHAEERSLLGRTNGLVFLISLWRWARILEMYV
jgi:hypothetical protein